MANSRAVPRLVGYCASSILAAPALVLAEFIARVYAVPSLNSLQQNFGVDVNTGGVCDTYDAFVWEPALVKINAIQVGRNPSAWLMRKARGLGMKGVVPRARWW